MDMLLSVVVSNIIVFRFVSSDVDGQGLRIFINNKISLLLN